LAKELVIVVEWCLVGSDKASQPVLELMRQQVILSTVPLRTKEYFLRAEDRKIFGFFVYENYYKGSMPPFASLPARHFHPNRTVVLSCVSALVYLQFYRQFNLLFLVFSSTNRSSTLSSIEFEGRFDSSIDGKSVRISSYF
jgi:hypothetical protein